MMRRIVIPTLVLAVLCLSVAEVQAGSALGLLQPYNINFLDDEDYEAFVGRDGTAIDVSQGFPVPGQGSFLLAMWSVQTIFYPPGSGAADPTTNTFTAISALKVKSVTGSDTNTDSVDDRFTYVFTPLQTADWNLLITTKGLLPAGARPNSASEGNTFVMTWDDGTKDNPPDRWITPDADGDKEAPSSPALDSSDWAADFGTALGTPLWEFGFTGTSGAPQNGEFFATTVQLPGAGIDPSTVGVSYSAGLNVTYSHPAVGTRILLPHDYNGYDWFSLGYLWQLQLNGCIDNANMFGDGFLKSDTNIYIKPTPEPGSIALLGLGLAAFGAAVYRRRRNR